MLTTHPHSQAIVTDWTPDTWRSRPALHQPTYPCPTDLQHTLYALAQRPGLVNAGKVLHLKQLIAQAHNGHSFILQSGDCAESFEHYSIGRRTPPATRGSVPTLPEQGRPTPQP